MRRRTPSILLSLTILISTLPAAAQQVHGPTVGILTVFANLAFWKPFLEEMAALGWQDGRNITFQFLRTEGSNEGLPALVGQLVAENVIAIVATGDPAITAAQRGAPGLPIVGITD